MAMVCTQEKIVKKAAESVWAASKYWVMAVDQKKYLALRSFFRQDQLDLVQAFACLKDAEEQFGEAAVHDLPELSNALFHVLGYFKKQVDPGERQRIHALIPAEPAEALTVLEEWASRYHVDYLLPSRLWNRTHVFNQVPIPLKIEGETFPAYTWEWVGDYVRYLEED